MVYIAVPLTCFLSSFQPGTRRGWIAGMLVAFGYVALSEGFEFQRHRLKALLPEGHYPNLESTGRESSGRRSRARMMRVGLVMVSAF